MRTRHVSRSLLLVIFWSVAGFASAQEPGPIGLTVAYPASIGVIWHASDRIAVRPDVTFSQSSGDTSTTVTVLPPLSGTSRTSSDNWTVAVGISGLFYLHTWDALRAYVSPRVAYTRGALNSTTTTTYLPSSSADHTTTSGYVLAGSFGAQYALGQRFGVFGEAGLSYSDSTTNTSPSFSVSSRTFGLRSGVGVLFYF